MKLIKNFILPILLDLYRKCKPRKYGWFGDYKSWEDAQKVSTGYEAEEILQKVRTAMIKVKKGEAVYERNGVIFDEIQYSWPLLAGLMFAAAKSGGIIRVLDFGGSLGTTYFQNKKFLDEFQIVSWSIVEQRHFVDVGRKEFQDDRLKFYYDIKSCIENEKPNILLLSSVLQYLEKPYEILDELLKCGFEFVIIDRTSFSKKDKDIIKLQIVPPSVYNASYPCWFFDKTKFLVYFKNKDYEMIEQFEAIDEKSNEYSFEGFIFRKRIK